MERKLVLAGAIGVVLVLYGLYYWYFFMEPDRMLQQGLALQQTSDYSGAIEQFSQTLKRVQANPFGVDKKSQSVILAYRADAEYWNKQPEAALTDLDQAIALYGQDSRYYVSRASIRLQFNQVPEQSLKDYDMAIALGANNASNYMSRAMIRCYLGNYSGTIEDAAKAAAKCKTGGSLDCSQIYYLRAVANYRLNNTEAAVEDALQAEKMSGGLLNSRDIPNFEFNMQAKLEYLDTIECKNSTSAPAS